MPQQGFRLVSATFLFGALVLFVAFHFLPADGGDRGWTIWRDVWRILREPADIINNGRQLIALASFMNFTLLILVSPFLGEVWRKSRLAWGIALACSGAAAAGFWMLIALDPPASGLQIGGWFLFLAPVLNFIGLLFARGGLLPGTARMPE